MPDYTLVSFDICPFVQRSAITLEERQVPHELEYIELANPPDWFSAASPLGKVPILLTGGAALLGRESVRRSTVPDIRERYLGYLQGRRHRGGDREPSWLGRLAPVS